ncbi:MAG: DsbA family protein [Nannocystales bacterium]
MPSIRWFAPLALSLVACHPKQSELDEINRRLDEVSTQQQQLIENLDSQWAQERQSERQPVQAEGPRDEVTDQLDGLQLQLDALRTDLRDLQSSVQAQKRAAAKPRPGRPDPAQRYRVDIGKSHVRGRRDALVTLIAFTDYQCPFCKRVQPTLEALRKQYGRNIRLVHKHNPLPMHNRALPAAVAAEAAGNQGKFWEMHERLWEDPRALTDETIEQYARELGLNMQRFRRDLKDPSIVKRIEAEQKQGTVVGARGTPAFFVNGKFISGAQPQSEFERAIDAALVEAREKVKSGTPRKSLYKALMKDALTEV